jgi:signal transduction histidine kinase
MERAIGRSVRWLIAGLVGTPLLLAVPTPHGSTPWILFHLTVLVAFGLVVTMALVEELDTPWFTGLRPKTSILGSSVSLVVLATGAVALVTLASSAALRLDPSMQFLQLLSALDIAWVAGATAIGARLAAGRIAGWAAGGAIVVVCVWSVATYLNAVGYTPAGGWLVDGDAMWRYILPYDMAAAVIAIGTLTFGVRRRAEADARQPMAQPSRQS